MMCDWDCCRCHKSYPQAEEPWRLAEGLVCDECFLTEEDAWMDERLDGEEEE